MVELHSLSSTDFSKAFDSVPHQRLFQKLASYSFGGKLLSCLKGFLSDRYQRVVLNGSASSWFPVMSAWCSPLAILDLACRGPTCIIVLYGHVARIRMHKRKKGQSSPYICSKQISFLWKVGVAPKVSQSSLCSQIVLSLISCLTWFNLGQTRIIFKPALTQMTRTKRDPTRFQRW